MQANEIEFFEQIYGDKSRLIQVIINFLSNSIKFSNQGSKIIIELEILQQHILQNSEFKDNRY